MAANRAGRALNPARQSNWIDLLAQAAFAAFLLLVFVGLEPFAARDPQMLRLLSTGEGTLARQTAYLAAFLVIASLAFALRGINVVKAFPIPLAVVLLWCLLSVAWAVEPEIAFRRAVLTAVVAASAMLAVDTIGTGRSLRVLYFVLAGVLIVNLLSLPFIPQATHLFGESDSQLIGNWRGIHFHKNIAGPLAASSALLFLHFALATRRWRDWLLFAAAVVFTVGTQSKTAIGFLAITIVISAFYRHFHRTARGRRLFIIGCVMSLLAATMVLLLAAETIADILSEPQVFTGRVFIWKTVLAYASDHPVLGAGFGSFWQSGSASPVLWLSSDKWIETVAHSHNGYLEILVTTGGVGLLLAVITFVIVPLKRLLAAGRDEIKVQPLLFSLLIFILLSNLLETLVLTRDRPEWVVFLIVLAILHQMRSRERATAKNSSMKRQPWRRTLLSSPS